MGVLSKLTLNIINKDLKISKIFLKKDFKIRLYDKSNILMAMLMLGTFETNNVIKV